MNNDTKEDLQNIGTMLILSAISGAIMVWLTACGGGSSPGVFQRTLPDADSGSDDSGDALAVSLDTGSPVMDAGVDAPKCVPSAVQCCPYVGPPALSPCTVANAPYHWTCGFTAAGQWPADSGFLEGPTQESFTLVAMTCTNPNWGASYLWCCDQP